MDTAGAQMWMFWASSNIDIYLREAVKEIDKLFGKDYAKNHPELVSSFMMASARGFHTTLTCQTIENGMEEVAQAIRSGMEDIACAIRDHNAEIEDSSVEEDNEN